jgi:hypothetical protein
MRRISVVVVAGLLVLSGLVFTGVGSAGAVLCDPTVECPPEVTFAQFHTDIDNSAYTSPLVRPALHLAVSIAETLIPTDPCRANRVLSVTALAVDTFARVRLVTPTGRSALRADISALIPTDPCIPPSPI